MQMSNRLQGAASYRISHFTGVRVSPRGLLGGLSEYHTSSLLLPENNQSGEIISWSAGAR